MRRGVRWAETTCTSYGTSKSASVSAAGSSIGQSESLPMTMPTTGSLMPGSRGGVVVEGRLLERIGRVDDPVGQVAGRGDRPRPHLGEVLAQGGHVPELAARALALAVPVHLHVGPVRHEVVHPLVQRRAVPARRRRGAA